jgi:hypothetical protein
VLRERLETDLVIAGYVRDLADGGDPAVDFTALVLDRDATVMWSSTSHATGSEGVWFFDAGQISTASALACRMARGVVDGMIGR